MSKPLPQNRFPLFLSNATIDALKRLCVDRDTRELVALQCLINEGLKDYLPKEVYESQKKRYSRTSKQIDEEKIWRETKREASRRRRAKRQVDSSITHCSIQIRHLEKDIEGLEEEKADSEDNVKRIEKMMYGNPKRQKHQKDLERQQSYVDKAIFDLDQKKQDLERERNRLENLYNELEKLESEES